MPLPGSHLQSPLSSLCSTEPPRPALVLGSANPAVLFPLQTFDANDLYQGQNFNKVLSSLVTLNKVTAGKCLSAELEVGRGSPGQKPRPSISHRVNVTELRKDCTESLAVTLLRYYYLSC